ncbi:hypothetical protein SteCoe_29497 [Stentor coeruleus]|uniref:VWFA domain-containing protein n=1 Tax=Stentor coeruleus TaxID=5963 RepID=A0A1R2B5V3_9CILI|nr:hypothetical protein SteCoe_29497 [Stentor coeruleus]
MLRKCFLILILLLTTSYAQDELTESDDNSSLEVIESLSELDAAIEAAEDELSDTSTPTSDDIIENILALAEVLDLMIETNTETVEILDVEYTQETLSEYIEELEIEAQEQEDIENAVAQAEDILDDGDDNDPTSLQLYDYAEALQDILDIMQGDDIAVIFNEEYTYDELEEYIEQVLNDAMETEEEEQVLEEAEQVIIDDLVLEITEALESDDLTDEEATELVYDIEELLAIADEDMTIFIDNDEGEDTELSLDDLEDIQGELEEDLNLDEAEAEFELSEELDDSEKVESSDDLVEDLEAIDEAIEVLDEGSEITIDGDDYDEQELEELSIDIEEDLENQIELEALIDEAEEILQDPELTSEDLLDLAIALDEIANFMDEDDIVIINNEAYTQDELEILVDETYEDADEAQELEEIVYEEEEYEEEELADEASEILEIEDLTLEDSEDLVDILDELVESLEDDEEILVDEEMMSAEEIEEEIEEIEEFMAEEENIIEAESVLEDGEIATSEDLEDLIDELEDLEIDEPIEIDGVTISNDEELEEYIEDLEDTAEELGELEDLEEEISEVEALLANDEINNSEELFILAEELEDVLILMSEDDVVFINDIGYNYEALEEYIEDLNNEATNLQHEEELALAIDEAIIAFGDGSTSEKLIAYANELEELLEIMDEDDVVIIMGIEYTEDGIEQEIELVLEKAQELQEVEELNDAIFSVEEAEVEVIETSIEAEEIIDVYENLIEEMEDSDEMIVDINGQEMTTEDLELEIDELVVELNDLVSQEELDEIALEIEEYVTQYVSDDGTVYITSELLEGELNLWLDLQDALDEGEIVYVDGFEYTSENIDDFIAVIEDTVDYLDDNDLVQVVVDGVISYMNEDDYTHMVEIDQAVSLANTLLAKDDLTSQELYDLADILETLLDIMYEDEIVVLDSVEYTYELLESFLEEIKLEAVELEHQEIIEAAAEIVEELIQSNDEWTTKTELEELIEAWEDLLDTMELGDEVIIDYQTYDTEGVENEISISESMIEALEKGEIYYTDPITGETLETIATVTESSTLTDQAYLDLVTSQKDYDESLPVISTASESEFIASEAGPLEIIVVINDIETDTTTFLQTTQEIETSLERDEDEAPEENPEPEDEYQKGETFFVLITTFIPDEIGTGKVFAIPKNDPENFSQVIIGLQEPSGLCFDVNHNFLYVADQGGLHDGGIFQYQISWSDDEVFTLENSYYVQIYVGKPSDCKVDAYGNLYFTEINTNSIYKVTYADLYSGYQDTYTILYSADEETYQIDNPVAIEVYESEDLYFVNNADGTFSGTLNKAEAEIEEINEEVIHVLVAETIPASGLALGKKFAYYSLENGEIRGYHLEDRNSETFSSGFFIDPKGLCYGDGEVFVSDYGIGGIFVMDEGDYDEPEVFVYIQAPASCYCVNVQDSEGKWIILTAISFMFVFN